MAEGRRLRSLRLRLPLGARVMEPLDASGRLVVGGLVALALAACLLAPIPGWTRALAGIGVLAAAHLIRRALVRRAARPAGHLVVDDVGIQRRTDEREQTVLAWQEPFGLTLLSDGDQRCLMAVTSRARTRYLPVRFRPAEAAARELLAAAALVSPDEVHAALGDDDDEGALSGDDGLALYRLLQDAAPGATERFYLTTPRGEPVELEARHLRLGDRTVDLSEPLDWRAFTFQEGDRALYQATWIRQADVELVLVASATGESGGEGGAVGLGALTREAPPREPRLAIDRLFMRPLRRALGRAPRASRPSVPTPRGIGGSERRA